MYLATDTLLFHLTESNKSIMLPSGVEARPVWIDGTQCFKVRHYHPLLSYHSSLLRRSATMLPPPGVFGHVLSSFYQRHSLLLVSLRH